MISKTRTAFYFRPLAVALVVMLAPREFFPLSLVQTAHAAPTITEPQGCVQAGGSFIIQSICTADLTAPSQSLISALQQWESDTIKLYLASFNLSATDADVTTIYQYARSDVRADIRGFMQIRMADMAERPSNQLSANETTVLNWFRNRLAFHELRQYVHALADFNSWNANHCTWKPDPDIAKVYGLHYIACVGSVLANNAPSEQYYLSAARKAEYDQLLANFTPIVPQRNSAGKVTTQGSPGGLTMFSMSSQQSAMLLGSLGGAIALSGGVAGLSQLPQLTRAIFPNRFNSGSLKAQEPVQTTETDATEAATEAETEADEVARDAALEVETECETEIGAEVGVEAAEVAGLSPTVIGLVVGVAVIAVSTLVTFVADEVTTINNIKAQLVAAVNNQLALSLNLDLRNYYGDPEGAYKIGVVWTEATYPDAPSIATLPSPDNAPLMRIPFGQTAENAVAGGGTFKDWYGAVWNLGTYGGFWLDNGSATVKVSSTVSTATTFDTISPTIRYIDWTGRHYAASRLGNNFVLYKQQAEAGDVACPADATTGLSHPANSLACTSFVSSYINLIDGSGNNVTVQMGQLPTFASQWVIPGLIHPTFYFNNNDVGVSRVINANGFPTPAISLTGGVTPTGLTFAGGTGQGSFNCCNVGSQPGSPTPGNYVYTLTASNIFGSATQQYVATIKPPFFPVQLDAIDPPPTPLYFGLPVTYRYHASGSGPYHFYTHMNLAVKGLVLTDRGNGIAEVTGTPLPDSTPCPSASDGGCAIWVSDNGTETFTLDANHASQGLTFSQQVPPSPVFTTSLTGTFPSGVPIVFNIKTANAITPVTISLPCGLPLSWLTLTDNGDGTAVIAGTSPRDTIDTITSLKLVAHALGTPVDTSVCGLGNFNVFFDGRLNILSSLDTGTTFVAGQSGTFTILSNAAFGDVELDTQLPAGLSFAPDGHGRGTIQGTPAVGTGGEYLIHFHVSDLIRGTYTPNPVLLKIGEQPSLSLPPTIYLMAGVAGSVTFDPAGYPKVTGMTVRLQSGSLPPGMSGSDVTTVSPAAGNNFVYGTPTAAAAGHDYPLTYLIQNNYGQTQVSTNLHVVPAGDVTRDDKVDCSDVAAVKSHLNTKAGAANYLAAADINGDGVINILDLAFLNSKLQTGTVCQ